MCSSDLPLTLTGTAADNVGVTQVTWSNDRGGSGTATGTTSWSASGIVLQTGVNVLTVTARDAAGNTGTDTVSLTYAPAGDTTPPTVAVTAPAPNATVSGTVTVTATASDDTGVAGVQFLIDGVALGAEVTAPPYSRQWNTTTVVPGPHVVTARARDAAGNTTTSSPVPVTVTSSTAATIGQWSAVSSWPLVAVHTTLLPNGRLLVWDGADQNGRAYVWTRAPTCSRWRRSPTISSVPARPCSRTAGCSSRAATSTTSRASGTRTSSRRRQIGRAHV